jgi:hypothetical protein
VLAGLERGVEPWSDQQLAPALRDVIQQQRLKETSPLISHALKEIEARTAKLARARRKPRTKILPNPFIAGPPVQDDRSFFGREDVLNTIDVLLAQRSVRGVVLYGARRTGKTSLLYRIRDGALRKSGVIPVYIDMQGLAGAPLSAFLRTLLRVVAAALPNEAPGRRDGEPWSSEDPDLLHIREFLDGVLDSIGEDRLVLMLDEYEVLRSYLPLGLADQFQSLMEAHANLFVIFAGARKLESMRSAEGFRRLLDITRYIKISFLSASEAMRLICEPAASTLEFADGVPEKILAFTAGHPFFTQLLCQTVFEVVRGRGMVEEDHVEEAVRRFLENPAPHLILTWNGLQLEQEAVGSTLATLQSTVPGWTRPAGIAQQLREEKFPALLNVHRVETALDALVEIDWVEKRDDRYRFVMELIRRWVVENRSISKLAERYREEIIKRVPALGRQRTAWFLDLVFSGCIFALVYSWASSSSEGLGQVVGWSVFLLYFVLPMVFFNSTLGQRLLHIGVIGASAGPLERTHAINYGLLMALRFGLDVLFFCLLYRIFGTDASRVTAAIVIGLADAAVEVLDNLMITFGRNRQGLTDKLAKTFLVLDQGGKTDGPQTN